MRVPTLINPRTQRPTGERPFVRAGSNADTASGAAVGNALVQAANAVGNIGGLLTEQAKQARRFGVLQSFSAFELSVDERLEELKRNADPAQGNFADQAVAWYSNWEQDWLDQLPDEFHDEFKTRAADVRAKVARNSLAFQYERTDQYFRQGVSDQLERSLLSLDQDGSILNLDRQRQAIDEYINSTTLTEAEKLSMARKAYTAIESVSYKSEVRRGNIELGALGVGSAPGDAAELIYEFAGPSIENGRTYAENRDLITQRVVEAEAGAVAAIGSTEVWTSMPDRARAALISLHDDLGELPPSVVNAVLEGDLVSVAGAVAALGGERREMEAEIILGNENMPEARLDADPRFANIPYEDRLVLRADAEREVAAEQAAAQKQAKAQQDAAINSLMVGLFDGNMGQWHIDQAREQGWLSDYNDISRAQKLLEDRDNSLRMTQAMEAYLAAGMTINPGSDDDRKMFNAWVGQEGLAAIRNRDSDYVANMLVPAVRTAGDLPTEAVGVLTGMMRAQDPLQALFALDTLSQLEQASPEAYQARVTEAVAADVAYWRTAKDYYPQQEVLASVRGGLTQEERTRNEFLRKEARTLISNNTVKFDPVKALGDLPQWRWGDPIMTAGQQAMINSDFQQLFEREYARDGNEQLAQERATAALGRIWNTTEIGGQQLLMRYPPELVGYETWNGSYDWITEQGRAELGLEPNQSFQLISDEQTKSEYQNWQGGAGPRPSYLVVYTDETGNLRQPLDENGQPQRIFFEITEEMNAEKGSQIERARLQQQRDEFMLTFGAAQRHSLNTGTPIPQELVEEFDRWREILPAGY